MTAPTVHTILALTTALDRIIPDLHRVDRACVREGVYRGRPEDRCRAVTALAESAEDLIYDGHGWDLARLIVWLSPLRGAARYAAWTAAWDAVSYADRMPRDAYSDDAISQAYVAADDAVHALVTDPVGVAR